MRKTEFMVGKDLFHEEMREYSGIHSFRNDT